MRRREFITSSAVALAVATVVPAMLIEKSWQDMNYEELTRHSLHKRQAGITPNYEETHECQKCGIVYLCPDRYVLPTCGPTAEMQRMGYKSGRNMSCSLCNMNVDKYGPAGYRQLWTEAHGIS